MACEHGFEGRTYANRRFIVFGFPTTAARGPLDAPQEADYPARRHLPHIRIKGFRRSGAETMIISSQLHQDDNHEEACFSKHFDCQN